MNLAAMLGLVNRNAGECIVKIGGSEVSEYYQNLQTTEVSLKRMGSSDASLTFTMFRADGRLQLVEDPRVRTWAPIEIIVVFGDTEEPFFSGYIREINTDIPEKGSVAKVVLLCQDAFSAMDRKCKRRTWDENQDNLDIIKEIIGPYGLTLDTNLESMPIEDMHQNKTDYRFIRELANKQKYEWYLRDESGGIKKLYFGRPRLSADTSNPQLLIQAGRKTNCLTFNISYDGYQPDSIHSATSPSIGTEVEQASLISDFELIGTRAADSTDSGLDEFEWCLPPGEGNNLETALARTQGLADQLSMKLSANGKLDGTVYGALLLPGTMVEVGGAGQNNGKWYVDTTTHTFDSGGYFVDFNLIRNAAEGSETSSGHVLAGVI